MRRYVLQLDNRSPDAWRFGITWPGYWAGLGYVKHARDAVHFHRKRDAMQAARGIDGVGLNGLLKPVELRK
jgi:hypothetical protein